MRLPLVSFLLALLCVIACSAPHQARGPSIAKAAENPPLPSGDSQATPREARRPPANLVIGELVGRHETIQITAGPEGPLYSVWSDNGALVAAPTTLTEMEVLDPKLHRLLKSTVANEARSGPILWTGMGSTFYVDRDVKPE